MPISRITANSITANTITSAALANTGVTAGVYGGAAAIPIITVDSVGRITSAANAALGVSNTANNLAAGSAGTIPYQTGSGSTAMLATGTAGQVLTSNGTNAPTWSTPVSSLYTSESLILTGTSGFLGGGGVYVLQNPSTIGSTLKLAGVPSQDLGTETSITSNRLTWTSYANNVKRDFYNNQLLARFRGTTDQGSGNQPISGVARSKDGNDWSTIAVGLSGGNPVGYDAAVNKYTGRNVVITTGQSNGNIFSNAANNLFNLSSLGGAATITGLNSITGGSATYAYYISFIDSGTQGSSYFLVYAIDSSTSYALYSLDGISWSASTIATSKYHYYGNFIGNNTEVMAGFYSGGSGGVARSLYNGTGWDTYNFGDSTHGTAGTYFPSGLTHNGTYWLSVLNNAGGTTWLTTKTMGSGTTWTFISGFPTTYGNPTSVAYSSTEGKWYVLTGGNNNRMFLYSSSQSDPNTSSWTLVQTTLANYQSSVGSLTTNINNIMALSSSTFNPTSWQS